MAEIVAIYFRINSHGEGVEDLNPTLFLALGTESVLLL